MSILSALLAAVAACGVGPTPAPTHWLVTGDHGQLAPAPGLHEAVLHALRPAHAVKGQSMGAVVLRADLPVGSLGTLALELRPMPAIALDARVEIGASARHRDQALTEALLETVHLHGSVVGHPHSNVYVGLGSTGIAATIDLGASQGTWTLRRVGSDAPGLCSGPVEFVRSMGTSAPEVPTCGADCSGHDGSLAGTGVIVPGARPVVELAVDSDFEFLRIFGGDQVAATEYIATLIGSVSAIYRRDCDTTIALAYVRLQPDADDLFNQPDPLGPFRTWWNENGADVDRDLFTLLTGRRDLPYGGVAWLNAACTDFGYSVNGYLNGRFVDAFATNPGNWDINVTAHEFGHNLGTLHTHDYSIDACASGTVQRGTIMSYCHVVSGASSNIDLRFHAGTVDPIKAFVASAPCLARDCDDDGLDDAAEIAADPLLDANGDGLLDACQDCNGNATPDPVEIAAGTLVDANANGRPDSCEPDCDGNGVADAIDAALDPAKDSNGDFVLQSCEPDCNADGIADSDAVLADMTLDRSRDGVPDACEDCDGDGTADFLELQGSMSRWVGSRSDALLRELDPRSGVLRRTVALGAASIEDLIIAPDGRLLAIEGLNAWALDRSSPDHQPVRWGPAFANQLRAIAVAPDGRIAVMQRNGRTTLHDADGSLSASWLPAFANQDARDLVFRTLPDGTHEAIATRSNGTIMAFAWPQGTDRVLADLSAHVPDLGGAFAMTDGSILVAATALDRIIRLAADGTDLGEWDVDNGLLLDGVVALCAAGDGRAILAAAPNSSSTVNGFALANGYTERTYRIYPADAPRPSAIVIAPPSATDVNGNLIPDECEVPPGDVDGDGDVDGADLGIMLATWGDCPGCAADLDGDGTVDGADLGVLLSSFGL
ncbi:MAG: zinc-dependent metalloprotease [Planctomycetes bacterium]|nr:zinc-dependent metalloprotease [Planctomycetota bacterium]